MASTLHLTNVASRSQYGPGRRVCAMAAPRRWEHGDIRLLEVAPDIGDLVDIRHGRITPAVYFDRYKAKLASVDLRPGTLTGIAVATGRPELIADGDTLWCACARRDRRRAGAPQCHLEYLASALAAAGWRVILYGEEHEPEDP